MIARIRCETTFYNILSSLFTNKGYKLKLKKELIGYFKVKNVILTQAARVGLFYILKVLPHKKIFIPSYTCWVVVEAAKKANKKIEFIDINLKDYNLDINKLKKIITPNSIILATHQFGIPCQIEELIILAKRYNCYVIEDNAAAFGSEYKNKKTGSFSGASIISFEYSKPFTCGKGGAILFNDNILYNKVRKIYNQEVKKPNQIEAIKYLLFIQIYNLLTNLHVFSFFFPIFTKIIGLTSGIPRFNKKYQNNLYKYDMANIQAKLAYLNLKNIKNIIDKREKIAQYYFKELKNIQNIKLPAYPSYKSPVWMRFPFMIKNIDKIRFYRNCVKKGIDLAFTFSYSCDPKKNISKNSHLAAKTTLNLPIYSQLNNKNLTKIKNTIIEVATLK